MVVIETNDSMYLYFLEYKSLIQGSENSDIYVKVDLHTATF